MKLPDIKGLQGERWLVENVTGMPIPSNTYTAAAAAAAAAAGFDFKDSESCKL